MSSALVISGGGSKGAFSAGVESVEEKEYDLYVGSSTGALNIIMFAQGKHKEAVKFYSSATNKTIFDKDPFNRNYKLKKGKIIVDLIREKQSFSSTNKLLKLIRDNYTEEAHKRLQRRKEIVVVVSNMTDREPEYKSNKDYDWHQFTFWVWVSTLAYPFAETINLNGKEYADGGFTVSLPIEYACKRAKTIRAIVLSEENKQEEFKNNNVINGLLSIIDFVMAVNLKKDINSGIHYQEHGVNINYIFMPCEVADQPMLFIPSQEREMVRIGIAEGRHNISKP